MSDWTPGPWRWDGPELGGYIWKGDPGDGKPVAQVRGWGWLQKLGEDEGVKQQDANARLIAEAPALVEALEECAADLEAEVEARYPAESRKYPSEERRYQRDMEPVRKARAVLARVRGE